MERWETVSQEAAKTHPLYGVGGWLVLPIIGMFFTPIVMAVTIYRMLGTVTDFSQFPKLYLNFLLVEMSLNGAMALWSWTNLGLIFLKRRAAVKSVIGFFGVFPVFILADAVGVKYMLEYLGTPMTWNEVFDSDTVRVLVRTIIGAGIWIPYMLQSRRVNVTFLHRVRPDDALAAPSNF